LSAPFRFSADFRPRLNQLAADLLHPRGVAGESGRAGRTPGRVEFKDHRAYAPGDDLRFLDWNVFLRSGALAVKTFTQDDAPEALVVLDRSASMGPQGSAQDVLAREIAAALGFLALRAGGEAVLACPGAGTAPSLRRRGAREIESWLGAVADAPPPEGRNRLDALDRLVPPARAGRIAAWVSDFLVEPLPAAAFAALSRASSQRFAFVVCAHDDALGRAPAGDAVVLGDVEGAGRVTAANDAAWRAAFHDARAAHVAAVGALAARHRFATAAASADTRFEEAVLGALAAP
jgi:uncharacterized protein (DUF58 family)